MIELAEAVAERAPARGSSTSRTRPGSSPRRSRTCSAAARSASATRRRALCRRVAEALGRPEDELWFDYFGLNHLGWLRGVLDGDRDLLPGPARRRRAARVVRGGPPLRRRVAALARDDPERVPLLLLLRLRHGRRAPDGGRRAASSCSASSGRSTRRTARRPTEALAAWRSDAARARADVLRRGAGRGRARRAGATGRTSAATRARRSRSSRRSAGNEGRVLILDTANRSSLPFLDERAVVEVPCVVGRAGRDPDRGRRRARARARADRDDQGGRAHDDPRGARAARATWPCARSRCTRSSRP